MAIKRRTQLIGLGSLILGAGAIVGTNAFSTVEANRSISVSTTGDDSAVVQIDVNESTGLVDNGGDTVSLNLENINKNGKTTFEDALEITVNDNSGSSTATYTISIEEDIPRLQFKPNQHTGVGAGSTVSFDLEVNFLPPNANGNEIPPDAEFTVKVEKE